MIKAISKIGINGLSVLSLLGLSIAVASAHANLVRSDPPADSVLPSGQVPAQVQIWFSEQPDPTYSSIRVVDARGMTVSVGNATVAPTNNQSLIIALKPKLPDGNYTVIWKTASAVDGHIVQSAFSFVVGQGNTGGRLSATLTLASQSKVETGNDATNLTFWSAFERWLNYVAGALLVGCVGFALLVWRPTLSRTRTAYALDSAGLSQVGQIGWIKLKVVSRWSLALLGLGWLVGLVFQLSTLTERFPLDIALYGSPLTNLLFNGRFGQIWLLRLGLIGVALLLVVFGLHTGSGSSVNKSTKSSKVGWWALLAVGVFILLTTSLNSHAAAQPNYIWFLSGVDWLHLIGTAFWIGGVLSLVLVLPSALRKFTAATGDRTRLMAVLIPTFSRLALVSVVLVVASGVYSSVIEVGSFEALFSTLYGQALLFKLTLFGVILLLAAGNLLYISPRLVVFASGNKAGSLLAGKVQWQFRQMVAVEAVLLVLVLMSVGVLTSLEPASTPGGANSSSSDFVQTANGLTFDLAVTPGQAGINNFKVTLTDAKNQPISDATLVQLRFQMLEMDMGQPTLELKPSQPGTYTATGAILSMVAHWCIEVLVQRPGQSDVSVPFQITLTH
jgi:copper transport protein